MLGFFAALTGRSVYKGTLSDPNGIPPMTITIPGSDRRIDLNLVAECGGVLALAVIILLYRTEALHTSVRACSTGPACPIGPNGLSAVFEFVAVRHLELEVRLPSS